MKRYLATLALVLTASTRAYGACSTITLTGAGVPPCLTTLPSTTIDDHAVTGNWVASYALTPTGAADATTVFGRPQAAIARDYLNIANFGGIADGTSHPLSSRFASIAQAQSPLNVGGGGCPEATSLTQQIDWCAMQAMIDFIAAETSTQPSNIIGGVPGGKIRILNGQWVKLGTTPLIANNVSLAIEGEHAYGGGLLIGANPGLQFGLNNGMAPTVARVATGGTGCNTNDVLTAVGGSGGAGAGATTVPTQVKVINQSGGVVSLAGLSIITPGSYGSPPSNPVAFTSTGTCSGVTANMTAYTNPGGALMLTNLNVVADAPGASVVTAQFDLTKRSTYFNNVIGQAYGSNYWAGGFDLTSPLDSYFGYVDFWNNLNNINTTPSAALFVMRENNALLGGYEHTFDTVQATAFTGGGVHYYQTDTAAFQGLHFHRLACGFGSHCLVIDNPVGVAVGNIHIDNFYSSQTAQDIEITGAINLWIGGNSSFGSGNNRLTTQPTSTDLVYLNNVNQWNIDDSVFATQWTAIPTVNYVHLAGTSYLGHIHNSTFTNAAGVSSVTGLLIDSGATGNDERDDIYGSGVTPVVDNGSNNTIDVLMKSLGPARGSLVYAAGSLTEGGTYSIPDNKTDLFFSNTALTAQTFNLPSNPRPGLELNLYFFQTISTVTWATTNGYLIGSGLPTSVGPSAPVHIKLVAPGRWQRV